jgi:hypothetical protein
MTSVQFGTEQDHRSGRAVCGMMQAAAQRQVMTRGERDRLGSRIRCYAGRLENRLGLESREHQSRVQNAKHGITGNNQSQRDHSPPDHVADS